MPDFIRLISTIGILASINILVIGQTNPDDYWLNHGFISGETITTNTGNFYDDGGFDKYSPNQNWNVNICSENGNPITLDFNHFRTHYLGTIPDNTSQHLLYDYMRVNSSVGNWSVFHFDTPQLSFTDPDGCINIGFVSQPGSPTDSGWIAEISANPPPANNDPCSAALLNVGNVCSPSIFSNKGAFDTRGLGSPACHRFFGNDVWFMAEVPASGQLKIETFQGGLSYGIMVLYSGTCAGLNYIQCIDNVGSMPSVILNRTPGETIFVRIFGDQAQSGTFGICATDPSAPIIGFTGPGGVGDSTSNEIWLKADTGILNTTGNPAMDGEAVKSWMDQSGNLNNLSQNTPLQQAIFHENSINGMPGLTFDGNNDLMITQLGNISAPISIFSVNLFNQIKDQTVIALGDANNLATTSISRELDERYYAFSGSKRYGPSIGGNSPYIIRNGNPISSPWHRLSINAADQSVENYGSSLVTDGTLYIGSSKDSTNYLSGNLGEIIIYNKQLNLAQEIIINNYLAAKYAIDILTADRYSFNLSHRYDVAGIGRVDAQNLHSKAQSAGVLAIGGASDLENDEFLFFGHDGGDFSSWTSTEVPDADTNVLRLEREWIVDNSDNDGVGNLSLSIAMDNLPSLPAGFLAYDVFVDSDGDFTSGAIPYGLIPSGNELMVNNVDIPDGSYLCIAAVKPFVQFERSSGEGEESFERPVINVSLNYAVSVPFEVNYSISGGTATPGAVDFSLNNGILLFDPGQKSNILQPLIINDTIVELPDEYFTVTLTNPTGGVQLGDTVNFNYTIIDDDISLLISASDTVIGECGSGARLVASATGREPLTYSWTPLTGLSDPNNDTTMARPAATIVYSLTVTDSRGNTRDGQININVKPLPAKPVVSPKSATSFCQGDSVVLVSDSAQSYLWSTNETTRSITVNSSGKYAVNVFDEFGCSSAVSDTILVTVLAPPVKPIISAEGDLSFCTGDSVKLSAPAADSYLWSTGETDQTIYAKTEAEYLLQVGDANSCISPVSDPVAIMVHSLPDKPEIQIDNNEICANEEALLTAPVADSYLWSTGETTPSISTGTAGGYTLIVRNEFGCESESGDTVNLIVHALPPPPVIDVSGDTEFCEGGSVVLSSTAAGSYVWSSGETSSSINVNITGTYTLAVKDVNNCVSPASLPVSVLVNETPDKPIITPAGPINIIVGDSVLLTSSLADNYLWSNGETNRQIYAKTAGSYSVVVSTDKGCNSISSDLVEISITNNLPAPEVTVTGETEFCEGGEVELLSESAFSYLWSNGETTQEILVKESGTFSVVVKNDAGVSSLASDPVEVKVYPLPQLESTITGANCFGGEDGTASIIITGGEGPFTFDWNNGGSSQTLNNLSAGEYTVLVTDSRNCSASINITVPQADEIVISESIVRPDCPDALNGEISLTLSGGTSPYTYEWDNGGSNNTISNLSPGNYSVDILDYHNCLKQQDFTLSYINEMCFRVPDIITPNNDGHNDTWKIAGLELYPLVEVEIYDRWGKRVFYSRGYGEEWDGTSGGKELPMESYHYIINLKNGSAPLIGNVTIVR